MPPHSYRTLAQMRSRIHQRARGPTRRYPIAERPCPGRAPLRASRTPADLVEPTGFPDSGGSRRRSAALAGCPPSSHCSARTNCTSPVDSSTKETRALKRLRDNDQVARNGLIEISQFTGTTDADIEDLFERDFYLRLVNRAYASVLSQPITPADLSAGEPRVTRAIEGYSQRHGISGKFNHYRPAAILLREQATFLLVIADTTIDRAAAPFTTLNGPLT